VPSPKSFTSSTPAPLPRLFANANYLAKSDRPDSEMLACEAVLASGLRDFLAELVTVDGTVMVSLICNEQHANLDDLIASSLEHTLQAGRLGYSSHAIVDFDWGKSPRVSLGMELRDDKLTAFFDVVLAGDHVGIEINGIQFLDRVGDATDNIQRFAAAVARAQLPQAAA
jgi:hypothetical protein